MNSLKEIDKYVFIFDSLTIFNVNSGLSSPFKSGISYWAKAQCTSTLYLYYPIETRFVNECADLPKLQLVPGLFRLSQHKGKLPNITQAQFSVYVYVVCETILSAYAHARCFVSIKQFAKLRNTSKASWSIYSYIKGVLVRHTYYICYTNIITCRYAFNALWPTAMRRSLRPPLVSQNRRCPENTTKTLPYVKN